MMSIGINNIAFLIVYGVNYQRFIFEISKIEAIIN